MRDIVDWLAFETNDTYTYCAAEAGRAYKPGKVPFFSRQILLVHCRSFNSQPHHGHGVPSSLALSPHPLHIFHSPKSEPPPVSAI